MKAEEIQFESAEDFLAELKRDFEESNNKLAKVAKLKKTEQRVNTMKEFVQYFRRAARNNRYKEWALVEENNNRWDLY